jgi:hypothetical protein
MLRALSAPFYLSQKKIHSCLKRFLSARCHQNKTSQDGHKKYLCHQSYLCLEDVQSPPIAHDDCQDAICFHLRFFCIHHSVALSCFHHRVALFHQTLFFFNPPIPLISPPINSARAFFTPKRHKQFSLNPTTVHHSTSELSTTSAWK